MADRLTEPGRFQTRRMLVSKEDAPNHVIALPYQPNLVRHLDEEERFERIDELARHATGPAARVINERQLSLALQELIVGRLDCGCGPGFEYRILAIGDANGSLSAIANG